MGIIFVCVVIVIMRNMAVLIYAIIFEALFHQFSLFVVWVPRNFMNYGPGYTFPHPQWNIFDNCFNIPAIC